MKTVLKIAVGLFLASTFKTLPLVYIFRFYRIVFKNLVFTRLKYLKTKQNTFGHGVSDPTDIFKPISYYTYVSPLEIDMYFHKSNSTYFVDLDIARSELVTQIFQKLIYKYYDNEGKGFPKAQVIGNIPYVPIGATESYYKKELTLFKPFEVRSCFFSWDHKWIFVLSKFIIKEKGKEVVTSYTITKYVFKRGRATIPPEELLKDCGYYSPEVLERAKKHYHLCESLANTTELDEIVNSF